MIEHIFFIQQSVQKMIQTLIVTILSDKEKKLLFI